jgi:hypothetical protein
LETIEILTEITRHQNNPADQGQNNKAPSTKSKLKRHANSSGKVVALNESKTVTDSLKEYLDNLNSAVVSAVNCPEVATDQEEGDEISIQETLTIKQRANGKFGLNIIPRF